VWLIPFVDELMSDCDPSLAHAIPEHCWDEYHTQYKVLYRCYIHRGP